MRTSSTIVEKIERLLLLPGWKYVPWHFPPYYRSYPLFPPKDER